MDGPSITVTAEEEIPSRTVRFQCGLLRETETFTEEDLEDVSRDAILDYVVDMLNVKFPEHPYGNLMEKLVLFRHTSSNSLVPLQEKENIKDGEIIEIVLSAKSKQEYGTTICPHILTVHTYTGGVFCDFCGEILFGLLKQGLKCQGCDKNFHKKCAYQIPNNCTRLQTAEGITNAVTPRMPVEVWSGRPLWIDRTLKTRPQVPHTFFVHSCKKPTICYHCKKLLKGVFRQGLRCKDCKIIVHKRCARELGNNCLGEVPSLSRVDSGEWNSITRGVIANEHFLSDDVSWGGGSPGVGGEGGKGAVVGVNIPVEGREEGRKEVEGKEQGRKEEEKVHTPQKLEDLIAREEEAKKGGPRFDKQGSQPSDTAASEFQMDKAEEVERREVVKEVEGGAVSQVVVDPVNEERRRKVVEMAKHAWDGYVQYAWGENELKPISRRGHSAVVFGKTTLGATIVDSLDTLYLMGLQDRFDQGKEWVKHSLNIHEVKSDISVFEFNIRFIGGLLSAYALSGDELLKAKAVEIADRLMPAFNTPSGIPKSLLNLATGAIKNWGWASGGCSVLAEFGSLHLEFQYLTYLTGDSKYLDKVNHIRQHLKNMKKPDGLYPNFLNPMTGNWGSRHISLGALGDSFYEYLLKSWLMTSKDDKEAKDMYYEAVDALDQKLVQRTSSGLMMVTDLKNGRSDGKMQHLTCFAGGMFALGAQHATNGKTDHYMDVARGVTNVCHESYQRTATKLGPEAFRIDASGHMSSRSNEKMYLLRPETVESYFYLWRTTKDPKYREWGWEVVQALEEKCRIGSGGYTGIKDVYNDHAPQDDVQQSFFIAETLKYLFLLFSDDSVLPLNSWVLNTEAHPFPVISRIPTPSPSNDQ